jgi:ABC-type Zn2+ transport system substrate-binding protein/surface adhesin
MKNLSKKKEERKNMGENMNENVKTGTCPICPKGCDLSAPSCGRGANYAKTGQLPEEGSEGHGHEHGNNGDGGHGHGHEHEGGYKHGHGHHGEHGDHVRLQFEKEEQQQVMKYLHHAVGASDNGGLTQEQAGEMFSVLTDEETAQLAELLKKLSNHWMQLAQ